MHIDLFYEFVWVCVSWLRQGLYERGRTSRLVLAGWLGWLCGSQVCWEVSALRESLLLHQGSRTPTSPLRTRSPTAAVPYSAVALDGSGAGVSQAARRFVDYKMESAPSWGGEWLEQQYREYGRKLKLWLIEARERLPSALIIAHRQTHLGCIWMPFRTAAGYPAGWRICPWRRSRPRMDARCSCSASRRPTTTSRWRSWSRPLMLRSLVVAQESARPC